MNGQQDEPHDDFLQHMNQWLELVMSLHEKIFRTGSLGPCDGKLYMQACSMLEAHARRFERMFDENSDPNSNGEPESDPEPEGDRPDDPAQ